MTWSSLRDATADTFRTLLCLDETPAIRVATWFPNARSLTDVELGQSIAGRDDADEMATFELNSEHAILVNTHPESVFVGYPSGSRISYVLQVAAIIAAARLGSGMVEESYDLWPEVPSQAAREGYDPVALFEHLRLRTPESGLQDAATRLLSITGNADDQWPGEDVPYDT